MDGIVQNHNTWLLSGNTTCKREAQHDFGFLRTSHDLWTSNKKYYPELFVLQIDYLKKIV